MKFYRQTIIKTPKTYNYLSKKWFLHLIALELANNQKVKPRSYNSSDKVWLNNKYYKIKQKWKLKTKFSNCFGFYILLKKKFIS